MSSVACSGMLAVDYPIVYLSGTYCIYLVAPFVSLVINVWTRYRARIRREEHHKHYCVWCMHLYYRSLRQSLELLSFNTFTPTTTTVHTYCQTQTTKTLFSSKYIHKQTPYADAGLTMYITRYQYTRCTADHYYIVSMAALLIN